MRRRKIWEEEQLRKKMEEEIFGTVQEEKINENESNESQIEEILQNSKKQSSSGYLKYIILSFIIFIAWLIFK